MHRPARYSVYDCESNPMCLKLMTIFPYYIEDLFAIYNIAIATIP